MANTTEIHTLGIDDVVIGLSFSILSLIEMVFYIPCMIVMRTDAELKVHSCIRMMFHLGITDLVHLSAQFLTGICVATGLINKIPTWLNLMFSGIFTAFSWYTYLPICNVIGFNRFVTICLPVWMLICWFYGVLWLINYVFMPTGKMAYYPSVYTFGIDDDFVKWVAWLHGVVHLSMSGLWYIGILIYLCTVRRSMTTEQSDMQDKERRIMAQACLICLYTFAEDQYWLWLADILYVELVFKYAYGLGNILWILDSGISPLIYLTLNKTIRQKVKSLVCKNNVESVSLKQSESKQKRSNKQEAWK